MSSPIYRHRHTVTFDETNLVGNVYFAHFAHWQGHCREHFLAEHAPGVMAALASGLALVTVSCEIEYYGEARAFDVIDIAMSLSDASGNRITMGFDYLRIGAGPGSVQSAPDLIAKGRQTVAVMKRDGEALRPARIPDELTVALSRYESRTRVPR